MARFSSCVQINSKLLIYVVLVLFLIDVELIVALCWYCL